VREIERWGVQIRPTMEKMRRSYAYLKKELTGGTRLLNGWGGRIGITMRKIIKADAIKDKKASTRAATREIIFLVVV
jgi:hypothetical protein